MIARILRRWRTWAAIAAGLLALYAVFGFFVVPLIARSQIVSLARSKLHREASVARVKFNPFTLAAVVEGLDLKDRDGAPLFKVHRISADFQLSGLFRRAWRFREIAVDGPSLNVRILADGKPSIADLLEPEPVPAVEPNAKKSHLPRLIVDRFVLRDGREEFSDASRSPSFVQVFEPLELDVRDLITIPDERGEHALTLGLGKNAVLHWSGRQTVEPIHLEGRVEITGISLARLWEYAAPGHPLTLSDGTADVVLDYDIQQQGKGGAFSAAVKNATVKMRGVLVRPRDGEESWLQMPACEASGIEASWPESRATVAAVRVSDPKVLVRRDGEGQVNWMAAVPPSRAETGADAQAGGSAPHHAAEPAKPWTTEIAGIEIENGEVALDDAAVSPALRTTLSGIAVRLEKVSSDLTAPIKTDVKATINGSGHATISGTIAPSPLTAALEVAVSHLDLTPFRPYARYEAGAQLRKGVAALSGRLRVSPGKPALEFDGAGAIEDLDIGIEGEDRLIAWDRALVRGIRVTSSPDRVRVSEIQIAQGFIKLHIDREGRVNLGRLGAPNPRRLEGAPQAPNPDRGAAAAGAAETEAASETTPNAAAADVAAEPGAPPTSVPASASVSESGSTSGSATKRDSRSASGSPAAGSATVTGSTSRSQIPFDIGKIAFTNAKADFTDESLFLPFGTNIHDMNGDLRDVSTAAMSPARLALEGRVAEEGYVKADGTLRIVDPFAATDVNVVFRNVNMPDLTPYCAQFAGYSLQKGALDLDVRYRVESSHLVGTHRVVAKDMILGPKVEGAPSPGLPVRLAVALLKDKDGRINLDVPVEGSLDSPEFNYKSVVWQAVKIILGNIVKAPFRAIGRLFGSDSEDLELVGFASGHSELPAPEQDKLAKLAPELAHRSEISLEIEGRFDPAMDAEALRRARLEAKIDAKRTGDANIDAILEALYVEAFSTERLEARRVEFSPAAPPPAPESAPTSRKKKKKQQQEPPPTPREAFDAGAFYASLRKDLLEAEAVGEPELKALAQARAAAIAAALTVPGGLEPSRVQIVDPATVKRKKQGSEFVPSEMTMNAHD